MSNREAFLDLLRGGKPSRPVWTADLSYWMSGQSVLGKAESSWDTEEGYIAFHQPLGVMPYYYYPLFAAGVVRYDGTVSESTETHGPVTLRRFVTPVGELVEESVFLKESACHGVRKHPVTTERDLDVLLYLLEHRRMEPAPHLRSYPARMDMWARHDGLPCLGLPRSPLSALCYEWAGMESMCYLMADAEAKVRHAMDVLEAEAQPVLDALCELAPPLVHFPDNLTSDNLAGWYDEFLGPVHGRRLRQLHAAGVCAAVHLDGTVRGLLPKLVASGFDAVEALTPKPAGDLTPAEISEVAGAGPVILWGGLPGVLFAPPYTWKDMERHLEALAQAWAGRRYVIGVADQVPPDGDITLCRRVAEWAQ